MKKLAIPAIAIALAIAALTLSAIFSAPSAQTRTKRDVIMMRCEISATGFRVTSFSASSSAPGKKSDNCAESVSTLHRDGFTIEDVGYVDAKDGFMVLVMSR